MAVVVRQSRLVLGWMTLCRQVNDPVSQLGHTSLSFSLCLTDRVINNGRPSWTDVATHGQVRRRMLARSWVCLSHDDGPCRMFRPNAC